MRILLVADPVLGEAMGLLLRADKNSTILRASSAAEALVIAGRDHVDIVLVDLRLPDMLVLEAIKLVRSTAPSAKVIVLGSRVDHLALGKSLEAGADGCLVRDPFDNVIIETLRAASRSGREFAREPSPAEGTSRRQGTYALSSRETEILQHVAANRSNREIAEVTGLSLNRVTGCLKSAYRKLGVTTRAEATKQLRSLQSAGVRSKRHARANKVEDSRALSLLSAREIEVVRQMAAGYNNREIGEILGLSRETVKTYLRSAFRKLRVQNRMEAARLIAESKVAAAPRGLSTSESSSTNFAPSSLTRGELLVLREAALGKTNPEIAAALGLSRNTVKTYLQIVFRKLGVRNRVNAIEIAAQHDLLT